MSVRQENNGDILLVFSQNLDTLSLLEDMEFKFKLQILKSNPLFSEIRLSSHLDCGFCFSKYALKNPNGLTKPFL